MLISTFVISGSGIDDKEIIVRALGPSLSSRGVQGALVDPMLQIFDADGILLAENDNWKETQQSVIESSGFAPTSDLESAVLITLPPSAYTALVTGKGSTSGVGMIDLHDLSPLADAQLSSIGTRSFAGTGSNAMIGGFTLRRDGASTATIVVRAIGPSLSSTGITGAMQDPILELRNANGVLLAANDNWRDTQEAAIESSGFAPADDRESAILIALGAGNYSAIVRGKNGATGIALVEADNLQ